MTDESSGTTTAVAEVLTGLTKTRLTEVGRAFDICVLDGDKQQQVAALAASGLPLASLLANMGRDELKGACRRLDLDSAGRARSELSDRILEHFGLSGPSTPSRVTRPSDAPSPGDIVTVRHRQWLVEDVAAPNSPTDAHLVSLSCLDDDHQGAPLGVLWQLELGARVHTGTDHQLGAVEHLDEPRTFGAYFHALTWNAVTASRGDLFQAPFRAGIKLMNHQLTPLAKALSLPRSNLFIADDVGLGKTIEAGLVLQELILRQRVDFVLIVCPASVALQWRDEMDRRFGRRFELYNRHFVAHRRRERGFAVNPWTTHQRFIVTYQTLRRPEYLDPLLQRLGQRERRSLLILDEAHTAAPASATKYAVDSNVTRMVRDIAPRFDNRLFLSATPHNGHSNSFTALLEILDRQRFTRGVPPGGPEQLEPIMVRRLKEDLRAIDEGDFPERHVVEVSLRHDDGAWTATHAVRDRAHIGGASTSAESPTAQALGEFPDHELELARLLHAYTERLKPHCGPRERVVFSNLQCRLLSSTEAFARTLAHHARAVRSGRLASKVKAADEATPALFVSDDDEYGDDDATALADADRIEAASKSMDVEAAGASDMLDRMVELADRTRHAPDAKVRALVAWIAEHMCPAARVGGADTSADTSWRDRRVIIFTEWTDTKRWLVKLINEAIEGTDRDDERILQLHGGLGDDTRAEIQRAFNAPPDEHPVRILIATDSAREGINLQAHCADLFHFDIPWNPARMEQRNGRIDRTLQPEPVVRCHYFHYPQRPEDRVLTVLVEKVERIKQELGSLGAVVMDHIERTLRDGIHDGTTDALDDDAALAARAEVSRRELEAANRRAEALRADLEEAGTILERSRDVIAYDRRLLREALDAGLSFVGDGAPLTPIRDEHDRVVAYTLPELPDDWQRTVDSLRPPRPRDEPFWEWRQRPPEPVVFDPPDTLDTHRVHLHLEHPFVKRVLGRFLAQGHSAHDLSRATVLVNRRDAVVRVIAIGRLSLFGRGATRLHDEIVSVAARWVEGDDTLRPFAERADRAALEQLEEILADAPTLDAVPDGVRSKVLAAAPKLFESLWPHVEQEADAKLHDVEQALRRRGEEESAALARILENQRAAIDKEIGERKQQVLEFGDKESAEKQQFLRDREFMEQRREDIEQELATEPAELAALYDIAVRRVEPVGLVVLWPETRT